MPMSDQKIPNKPLNGKELAQVIEQHVHDMLAKDCMFLPTLAYGRCAFTVMLKVHVGDLVNPKVVARTYARKQDAVEGDVPLVDQPADGEFIAKERKVKVANPNLTRIHAGIPIRSQLRTPPKDGSPFGGVENVEQTYAPGDYEPLDPPEETDVSEREAKALGVYRQQYLDRLLPKEEDEKEPARE